jgi:hypothetical protein
MRNRIVLLLAMLMTAKASVAGSVEYELLIPSQCAHYSIDAGSSFPDQVDGRSNEDVQQEYDRRIASLMEGKDENWQPWSFSPMMNASGRGHYTSLCKEIDNGAGTPVSLACVGEPDLPLSDLTCKFGSIGPSKFHRNAVCTSRAYPHQKIKMYWVDTAEYEMGGNSLVNRAYQGDHKRMVARCKRDIP